MLGTLALCRTVLKQLKCIEGGCASPSPFTVMLFHQRNFDGKKILIASDLFFKLIVSATSTTMGVYRVITSNA
jgi:hypothetical protein